MRKEEKVRKRKWKMRKKEKKRLRKKGRKVRKIERNRKEEKERMTAFFLSSPLRESGEKRKKANEKGRK